MKKVIILVGPTGVGKTAVSLLLARVLHSEIISADSMQIYRHMDIGTAKPTAQEMLKVKHHMIDIVEPWESFSTGAYIAHVRPVIDALLDKEKIPVIVGGTGLFIKAMTRGIFSGPSADWELRNKLKEKEKEDPGFLYNYLKSLDAVSAARIMPADTRRIIRALEVCLKGNLTMSSMQETLTKPLPHEFIKVGITRDRKELYTVIEARVDTMVEQGLVNEVRHVIELIRDAETFSTSPVHRLPLSSLSSMQAIGYKEMAMHLNGEISLDEAIGLIKQRSRNYAKRQFTWFKKEEGIQWVDVTGEYDPNIILQKVMQFIPACKEMP